MALVICGLVIGLRSGGATETVLASFHEDRIYGVMGGEGGSEEVQFVELRMAIGGQNQVQQAQLCFYDADGVPWARFVFPNAVAVSTAQASVLVGTALMADDWNSGGAQPDFTFTADNTTALNVNADVLAPIPVPAGAIVYESKTDTGCGSPLPIDSIAYGTGYNGVPFFGSKFNHDLPKPNSQGFQLATTPVGFPPTDNSSEYHVVTECIVARNNAGVSGTVGTNCAPSPTPTPTASPTVTPEPTPSGTTQATPTPTLPLDIPQGDADCSGHVDEDDAIVIIEGAAGVGDVPCPERADADCENGVDVFDALRLFKHIADIRSEIAGCTPIEEPLPA